MLHQGEGVPEAVVVKVLMQIVVVVVVLLLMIVAVAKAKSHPGRLRRKARTRRIQACFQRRTVLCELEAAKPKEVVVVEVVPRLFLIQIALQRGEG